MGPEATKLDVGLWDARVGDEQPNTEDGLGEDVKNSVGQDLAVDRDVAATVSNTPDTVTRKLASTSL